MCQVSQWAISAENRWPYSGRKLTSPEASNNENCNAIATSGGAILVYNGGWRLVGRKETNSTYRQEARFLQQCNLGQSLLSVKAETGSTYCACLQHTVPLEFRSSGALLACPTS